MLGSQGFARPAGQEGEEEEEEERDRREQIRREREGEGRKGGWEEEERPVNMTKTVVLFVSHDLIGKYAEF